VIEIKAHPHPESNPPCSDRIQFIGNFRAALIAVLAPERLQILFDELQYLVVVGQQVRVDTRYVGYFLMLIFDFLPFQSSQAAQLHIEDSDSLRFGQPKGFNQAITGRICIGDWRIISITSSRLSWAISSPDRMCCRFSALSRSNWVRRRDDFHTVVDVDLQGPLQREQARLFIHQGQHLNTKGGLQGGMLVKLVQHLQRLGAPL
jgi:hypothetical protein